MFDHVGVTMFKSRAFMSENVTVSMYVRMCERLCVHDHIWQVNEHSHIQSHLFFRLNEPSEKQTQAEKNQNINFTSNVNRVKQS